MLPTEIRIGIIGGGQLGKMLIEASRPWNVYNTVLENSMDCPSSLAADKVIVGSLYDAQKIEELAAVSDVLTFEIEHINSDILLKLEAQGMRIIPSPRLLKIIQDKGLQKEFFKVHEIPSADFKLADSNDDWPEIMGMFPGEKIVVKSRTGGYDGKGVQIVFKSDLLEGRYTISDPVVIEQYYENITEYAVIVARDETGNNITFPLIEMYFNPNTNLVEFLFSPANINSELEEECRVVAKNAIDKLDGIGLFAVELFVTNSGEILVNEIAPRPHNSGHHTIEGCYTSQFEQLNRILLKLPLGSTELIQPAAMINLVGPEGLFGNYKLKNTDKLLDLEGVFIHLYNKKEIKPNRKMGHITVTARDKDTLMIQAKKVMALVGFE